MALTPVQQTLFFPLLGRAEAARRWPEAFSDPWAQEAARIHAAEGGTTRALGAFAAAVYGLRHLIGVTEVNRYLADHPGAAVVNIGCGLDRLVDEIDDPDAVVHNLDFPDVLEVRRAYVAPHERERDLPYSVTDHAWMDHVDASRGLVASAGGVFYYLEVAEVAALVGELGRRLPGSRLAYDAESPLVTASSEWQVRLSGAPQVRMPFRVKDAYAPRGWSDTISDVRVEHDFTSYLPQRRLLPPSIRARFTALRIAKGLHEVVVTFDGNPRRGDAAQPGEIEDRSR